MHQKVWMGDISLESFINAQKRSLMVVNFNSNIHQQKLRTVMSSRTLFFHCRLHAKFFRSRHFPSGMQSMCWWFFFLCYVYFWPSPKRSSLPVSRHELHEFHQHCQVISTTLSIEIWLIVIHLKSERIIFISFLVTFSQVILKSFQIKMTRIPI